MKKIIKKIASKAGYEISQKNPLLREDGVPVDIHEAHFIDFFQKCKDFSVTTVEPLYALFQSVEYIIENNIPGDFVECGVWKGGSAMMMAYTLMHHGITDRKIYLYDTYEGMAEPEDVDEDFKGIKASHLMATENKQDDESVWCFCSLEDVKKNLALTGFPSENLVFVKGRVEETIPAEMPEKIGLLRLDTDWYESTYHELKHLYPLLSKNGMLIIDDYGHWKGAREAVDKYFSETKQHLFFNRVDYSVRAGIKI